MADATLLDNLANNSLVQAAVFIATVAGAVLASVRGGRKVAEDQSAAPPAMTGGVYPGDARFFFDGPITRALEFLQGIYRNSAEIRTESQRNHDEVRGDLGEIIDLLRAQSLNGQPHRRRRGRRA